ncbi:MAG: hypothetical protein DSM106950_09890 [Stigonema ocellatum SAG 48.90 = DSM 106950]|nr:hypothetical protein [Stigonema ocellatum SAG 48.90 = DSM 106950]
MANFNFCNKCGQPLSKTHSTQAPGFRHGVSA